MTTLPPWVPPHHSDVCEYVNPKPPGTDGDVSLCNGCADFLLKQGTIPVRARNVGPDFEHVAFEAPRLVALPPMGIEALLAEMPERSTKAYPGVKDCDGLIRSVLIARADMEAALRSHHHHLLVQSQVGRAKDRQ